MKRLHIHVRVEDLAKSIQFYSTLFDAQPVVTKDDYAKWLLDDPKVNFAISPALAKAGVDHVGIQTDSSAELAEMAQRLHAAGIATRPQQAANCCYAVSDKQWTEDPSGVKWETFYTHGEITHYGEDKVPEEISAAAAPGSCC